MNQKTIARLVASVVFGCGAASALAGQIQSSSVTVAREVITSNEQALVSPRASHRFLGDIDGRSAMTLFQIQFVLGNGATWANAGDASNIEIVDGVTGCAIPQTGSAAAACAPGVSFEVQTLALSDDKTTLYATIYVPRTETALIRQPIVTISNSATASSNPTIKNLKTVAGNVAACDTAVKTLSATFKEYVALSMPTSLATDANATPDEHNRVGSFNTSSLLSFPTSIKVNVAAAAGGSFSLDSAKNTRFAGSNTTSGNTVAPAAGASWQPYLSPTLALLGQVALVQAAYGFDTSLANQYLIAAQPLPSTPGIVGTTTATRNDGAVEAQSLKLTVSSPQGFAPGAALFLATSPTCAANTAIPSGSTSISSANATGPLTLTVDASRLNALGTAGTDPVYVCYDVTGATQAIPGLSFNIDEARLVKATDGGNLMSEQDNFCSGPAAVSQVAAAPAETFRDAPLPPWAILTMTFGLLGVAAHKARGQRR